MKTHSEKISIKSSKRFDFINLNSEARDIIKKLGVKRGILPLFYLHTTTALVCNEKDPTIHRDFLKTF